jgi:hypothetical protein
VGVAGAGVPGSAVGTSVAEADVAGDAGGSVGATDGGWVAVASGVGLTTREGLTAGDGVDEPSKRPPKASAKKTAHAKMTTKTPTMTTTHHLLTGSST